MNKALAHGVKSAKLNSLTADITACTLCAPHLPLGPRPVVRLFPQAKLLLIGQAPGTKVHATGVPWNDASGDTLRQWLGMDRQQFYDSGQLAIMPMGFCYPGKGSSGDLPPRPECAPLWHTKIQALLPDIQLTLLIGSYAQAHYLRDQVKATLTETVQNWRTYAPQGYWPLVHPSPRNRIWQKRNPWFEAETLPALRQFVHQILG